MKNVLDKGYNSNVGAKNSRVRIFRCHLVLCGNILWGARKRAGKAGLKIHWRKYEKGEKKYFISGMALCLALTNAPLVSNASEAAEGAAGYGLQETGQAADKDEREQYEAEVRRQMEEEKEEHDRKEREIQAEAERRMAEEEAREMMASGGEEGLGEDRTSEITWRVDGDTVVITGEGYLGPFGEAKKVLEDAMAQAEHVRFENCKIQGSMQLFFKDLKNLKSIDLSGLDTSQVTDMGSMFRSCSGLTVLDVSGFDTSQVTNMKFMFDGCSSLTGLDVSDFDTAQVTDMGNMFSGCSSLTSLDLSSFDVSQVVDEDDKYGYGMQNMFARCDKLDTIKAFKVAPVHVICELPGTYTDENGNRTNQITAEFAGKILKKAKEDTPEPDSTEKQVREFVSRMYTVALGRIAEEGGLNDWTSRLLNHEVDGAGIADGFIMSDEFKNKNVADGEYVNILYRTFFDREADNGGRVTWTEALTNGNSRAFVLAGFVNSVEFDNLCSRYGIVRGEMQVNENPATPGVRNFVERCYIKVLGREGEKAGVDDWTGRILRGEQTPESVAKLFFFSEEYVNKNTGNEEFVEMLYQTFMDRASDPAGKADWVGRLAGGMSREEVLEGFSRSDEFAGIMESFGL